MRLNSGILYIIVIETKREFIAQWESDLSLQLLEHNLFKNLVDASSILAKLPFFLDANNISMLLFHPMLFTLS